MTHPLLELYGDPVRLVDRVPRTATELYRLWTKFPYHANMTRRRRRERLWLARYLYAQSRGGVISRGELASGYVAFWRETNNDAP